MANIHVVIDSTACVPACMLQRHPNLHEIPLTIRLGEQEWAENMLTADELFAKADQTKQHPCTSQPSPGDFTKLFTPLVKDGNKVLVITLSGGLSGTAQGAKSAAKMVSQKDIIVIDSGGAAGAILKMAETALRLSAEGQEFAAIGEAIKNMAARTKTYIIPGNLNYLHKGGRIGGAATLFGNILQIKPVLYLVDGRVELLDKVRTKAKAVNRVIEALKTCLKPAYINVGYNETSLLPEAQALITRLQEEYPGIPVEPCQIGAVLSAHVGPGTLGVIIQDAVEGL